MLLNPSFHCHLLSFFLVVFKFLKQRSILKIQKNNKFKGFNNSSMTIKEKIFISLKQELLGKPQLPEL